MTRIGSFVTIAALVLVAPLAGQGSKQMDAFATVVISPALSLAKMTDLRFGTHFASEGKVTSGQIGAAAFWEGSTDGGACLSVAFTTLPEQLTRVGGTDFVTVTYGVTSGDVFAMGSGIFEQFNPDGLGLANFALPSSNGNFQVSLGHVVSNASNDVVSVDLTNKPAGTYSGTIMLTVTVKECPAA